MAIPSGKKAASVSIEAASKKVTAKYTVADSRLTITLDADVDLATDQTIRVEVSLK